MKILFLIVAAFVLAGCSSSEKMLESSTPKSQGLATEKQTNSAEETKVNSPAPAINKTMYQNPPELVIDENKKYLATFATSKGSIEVELFAANTPKTVNNFVFLAKEKFYDGVIFHRTIPGFMIQGGDPTGTGSGGPGYTFPDEEFTGEYTRGTLAMANAGPNTNGSQFFIMHKDTPLPKSYVIFGKVRSGIEVVDTIATAPTKPGGEGSSPQNPVVIENITISEE